MNFDFLFQQCVKGLAASSIAHLGVCGSCLDKSSPSLMLAAAEGGLDIVNAGLIEGHLSSKAFALEDGTPSTTKTSSDGLSWGVS